MRDEVAAQDENDDALMRQGWAEQDAEELRAALAEAIEERDRARATAAHLFNVLASSVVDVWIVDGCVIEPPHLKFEETTDGDR